MGANLSEGYSRGTGRDRARFYEYALGSARESRTWYYSGRHVLDQAVTSHRLRLLTKIIRLVLKMVPQQRGRAIREPDVVYSIQGSPVELPMDPNGEGLENLLNAIPYSE